MVARYRKGYVAELSMVHTLAKLGYMVIRAPRSGRISLASPDIVALKNGTVVVLECKAREEAFKIEAEQLQELKQWQDAGAKAYVAWKVSRKGWVFLRLQDVIWNSGHIGKAFAGEKGIKLEELDSSLAV